MKNNIAKLDKFYRKFSKSYVNAVDNFYEFTKKTKILQKKLFYCRWRYFLKHPVSIHN